MVSPEVRTTGYSAQRGAQHTEGTRKGSTVTAMAVMMEAVLC